LTNVGAGHACSSPGQTGLAKPTLLRLKRQTRDPSTAESLRMTGRGGLDDRSCGRDDRSWRLQDSSARAAAGREKCASRKRGAYCEGKIGYEVRLENVGAAAGFHGGFHEGVVLDAGEEDNFRGGANFLEATSRLKAVHDRHHDVEDEDVGLQAQGGFNCLLPVQRGADYLKLEFQKAGDGAENLFTVIG
jgi:hypothetical protein